MSNGVTKNASVAIHSNPSDDNYLYIYLENVNRPKRGRFFIACNAPLGAFLLPKGK